MSRAGRSDGACTRSPTTDEDEDFRKAEDHKIEGHELKNDGLVYPYTSNRSVLRKRFEF